MAGLVTSAVKTVGDCSTDTSFPLRPNASWPEAFLALSDIARFALRASSDLNRSEAAENLMCKIRTGIGLVTYLVADLSPGFRA
jgi:hypothetical protein